MDFCPICSDVRTMSMNAKLDRSELRNQRRYMSPTFEVLVECELFRSLDWSAGGLHLDGVCEDVGIGSSVEGWISLPGTREAYAFSGRVLRTDEGTGNTVLHFDDIEEDTAAFLDRSIAWRLN
jgi:hypothetical protein